MYQQKIAFPLSVICLGLLFAISACGQDRTSKDVKAASEPRNKLTQENRRKTDGDDPPCDFSSYNTIQATPLVKKQVKAAYPKTAERKKIAGIVRVKVLINRAGKVEQACAVEGHELLIPSAMAAAKLWEFSPRDVQKNLERMKRDYFESVIVFRITSK